MRDIDITILGVFSLTSMTCMYLLLKEAAYDRPGVDAHTEWGEVPGGEGHGLGKVALAPNLLGW